MEKLIYVSNKETIVNTDFSSMNHFLINLPNFLTPEKLEEPKPLETIYEIVKTINEDEIIRNYITYGSINEKLHENITDLINKTIYHRLDNYKDYIEPLKEELKKLNEEILTPCYGIKLRFTGLFKIILKTINNNPFYGNNNIDDVSFNYLIRINNS